MRSDPTMAVAAVVVVVATVLAARHGRTWWHRHTGDHHPARIGRFFMAGLALLGLGVLTTGMALGAGSDSTADPQSDLDGDRATPAGDGADGPSPAAPGSGPPVTASAGS